MKKLLITSILLSGASVPVYAQTAPAAEETTGLQEIIVTAERRTSTVQKSSLSIQVLSAAELAQVRRPADLNTMVPGIQIGSGGVNPQIYIRGVGDAARNSRVQAGVVISVDGAPLARPSLSTTQFFDIQRVEVLKGPQGTLYGRNASGGAINMITARPILGELGGFATFEAGNLNLVSGEAALNVPLGATTALRVSGKVIERDGYLSDGAQDQRSRAARARLLIEPSSDLSILLGSDYSTITGQGSGVTVLPVYKGNPWYSNTDTRDLAYPFQFNANTAPFTSPNDRMVDSSNWGLNAEVNANLGFAKLTVIPAFRRQTQTYISYNSNFRFKENLRDDAFSAEVRLANGNDAFQWILGGFYYVDKFETDIYPQQGSLGGALRDKNKVTSYSAFGHAIYSPVQNLRLIGGLRYSKETTTGTVASGTGAAPEVPFVQTSQTTYAPSRIEQVNWKAGVEYDVGPASMLYVNGTTGFKGGGTNPTACGGPNYGPEKVKQFLAGSRNRFLGGTLQVNAEAFLLKTEGQQVSAITQVCDAAGNPGANGFLTFNVGKATIYGGNIDVTWAATPNDKLHFFAEYTNSNADSFVFQQIGAGGYATAQRSLCSATAATAPFFRIDCSGQPLPRVPSWSLQADYTREFVLANDAKVSSRTGVQHVTSRWLDIGYGPNGKAPAYTVVNTELTYSAPSDKWSVSAFVNNITNEAVYTSGTSIAPTAPNGVRYYTANIEPPRTYGMRFSVKY